MVANDNKYQINSAAIIGCNWGLVHLSALRNSNIDVSAIVDLDLSKAQHLAKQHNIAHACNDVQQIPTVDLVIVASPAVTHQALIQHFQHCAIICEKPLLGLSPSTSDYAWPERLWVNYAFSHLASARLVDRIVAEQSQPVHITLSSQVNLPLKFTLEQWFLETSSHPLSWLLHRFGQPKQTRKTSDGQHLSLQLECANNRIDIDFTLGGELGIFHQIEIAFGAEKLSVEGEYIPGRPWRFSPVMLNNKPQNQGEFSQADCWIEANQRSTAMMIEQFRGHLSKAEFVKLGGFDASKALWLEQALFSKPN